MLRHCHLIVATFLFSGICLGQSLWTSGITVLEVQSSAPADLVLIGAGFSEGYRNGMICNVQVSDQTTAEIIIVESRMHHSTALITKTANTGQIKSGNAVIPKSLKLNYTNIEKGRGD